MTIKTQLTPAQDYATRMINALDEFLENPGDMDWRDEILMFVLERPKTLRSALVAYLHKSHYNEEYRRFLALKKITA